MKRALSLILFVMSASAFSADPFTTPYKGSRTVDQVKAAVDSDLALTGATSTAMKSTADGESGRRLEWIKKFRFFQFSSNEADACGKDLPSDDSKSKFCDSVFGGIALSRGSDTQTIKLNPVNYNLWLGGRHYLPFQIYVSETASTDGSPEGQSGANKNALFDPESGLAIRVPLMLTYDSDGSGFCSFGKTDIGRCSLGGDISFHAKELKAVADSKSQMAYGTTVRVGASFLFPVLEETRDLANPSGYLGISGRFLWARTNLDDSSKLFTPVLDANGNAVPFANSVRAVELEVALGIFKKLQVSARWVKPIGDEKLFKDQFKVSLQQLF